MYRIAFILTLLLTLTLATCSKPQVESAIAPRCPLGAIAPSEKPKATLTATSFEGKPLAPLFDNLGNYDHPISNNIPLAQRYFDQGLIFYYGFNPAEAERSFREAARLDPSCAMCYWGIALALGPNINRTMPADAVPEAWTAIQNALRLGKNASEKERDYIQALAKRYSPKPVENRSSLNVTYANAMREVKLRHPEDLDAATLFAEALMDITPWSYWTGDGKPKANTPELITTLESVLQSNPNHPGANHFYIHAVEAKQPELAIASAHRLATLVPGAGHLVHMPSHIYIQVGRYHDAVVVNQRAIKADEDYEKEYEAQGFPRIEFNRIHNRHFLLFVAMMAGESKVAIQTAQKTAIMADPELMRKPGKGTLQQYYAMPLYVFAKFGMWDKILAQPAPDADLLYPTGVWHYVRGIAFTAKKELEKAQQELKQLQKIASQPIPEKSNSWEINFKLLKTASEVLAGEVEAKQGNFDSAIAHLKTAVKLDLELTGEPALWYSPVRQSLGAVLLEAKRPAAAEEVYRQDLELYPHNGWSLLGLAQSLQAQGKIQEAQAVQEQFEQVWKYADVKLTASRF